MVRITSQEYRDLIEGNIISKKDLEQTISENENLKRKILHYIYNSQSFYIKQIIETNGDYERNIVLNNIREFEEDEMLVRQIFNKLIDRYEVENGKNINRV